MKKILNVIMILSMCVGMNLTAMASEAEHVITIEEYSEENTDDVSYDEKVETILMIPIIMDLWNR